MLKASEKLAKFPTNTFKEPAQTRNVLLPFSMKHIYEEMASKPKGQTRRNKMNLVIGGRYFMISCQNYIIRLLLLKLQCLFFMLSIKKKTFLQQK